MQRRRFDDTIRKGTCNRLYQQECGRSHIGQSNGTTIVSVQIKPSAIKVYTLRPVLVLITQSSGHSVRALVISLWPRAEVMRMECLQGTTRSVSR